MEPAYRYHKRVLKLLQWRCPPDRWWLKSPAHMHSIDALDAVYPDARFVMTHRDVGAVLPSVCALYDTLSRVLTDRPDPVAIGTQNLAVWRTSLERLIAFRDRGNEHRFHDLAFEDVQRDPLGAMDGLYASLGDELTDEVRQRMQDLVDRELQATAPLRSATRRRPSASTPPTSSSSSPSTPTASTSPFPRPEAIAGGGVVSYRSAAWSTDTRRSGRSRSPARSVAPSRRRRRSWRSTRRCRSSRPWSTRRRRSTRSTPT